MNPFKFGTIVDGDYFTDRVEETALLKQKLDSENHIVLISPRRYGKSSLVQRVLADSDRPQIRLDMQYVVSVSDFAAHRHGAARPRLWKAPTDAGIGRLGGLHPCFDMRRRQTVSCRSLREG